MKKIVSILLCLLLCFTFIPTVYAYDTVPVFVNDTQLNSSAIIINDRTLVPMRELFNAMGAVVEWDEHNSMVTAYNSNICVIVKIENCTAFVNGIMKNLDVAPTIINSQTYVPVRFVGESFKGIVSWYNNSVYIKKDLNDSYYYPKTLVPRYVNTGDYIKNELCDNGIMIYCYKYQKEKILNYLKSLRNEGWYEYNKESEFPNYAVYYTNGNNIVLININFQINEIWIFV